jgi:hypothetical protein
VISVKSCAKAWAAMSMAMLPMGLPHLSSSALIFP